MRYVAWFCCFCLLTASGCGNRDEVDASGGEDLTPGVCELDKCPAPETGVACCRPNGGCGQDIAGAGLVCSPNEGDALTANVCILAECPVPSIGAACCTPTGTCGNDPWGLGIACYANSPIEIVDAGPVPDTCGLADCPLPQVGFSCCTVDDQCGNDPTGAGTCYVNPREVSNELPDHPSVDAKTDDGGYCPSFTSPFGPLWGCCHEFGLCGRFDVVAERCLVPDGTLIPRPREQDAGIEPFIRCTPPVPE